MQFYQRAEIKDIVAYLAVINNPKDSLNLSRILNVPKRKIGDKSLEKINEFASVNGLTLFEALGRANEIDTLTANMKIVLEEFHKMMMELIEMSESEPVSELFDKVIKSIKYFDYLESNYEDSENRISNIEELRNSITEMEKIIETLTLREYLENISLVSATDNLEEEKDYVKLMTIHNSKGLEFPTVFLVGTEDEVFPGKKLILNQESLKRKEDCAM